MKTLLPKLTQLLKDCGYSLLRHGKGDHDIYTDDKGRECVISRHATDRNTVNKWLKRAGIERKL